MWKSEVIDNLKHDVIDVLTFSEDKKNNNRFSKIPESVISYIVSEIIKVYPEMEDYKAKLKRIFKRKVSIKEVKTDQAYFVILRFFSKRVHRNRKLLSGVALLDNRDKFDDVIGFKIAMNRIIRSLDFEENLVNMLFSNQKLKFETLEKFKDCVSDKEFKWFCITIE